MSAVLSIILKVINFFFPAKTAEKVARDDGQSAGIAVQKATDQSATLKDIQDAKEASQSVSAGIASGVPISESDGFRRD